MCGVTPCSAHFHVYLCSNLFSFMFVTPPVGDVVLIRDGQEGIVSDALRAADVDAGLERSL